MREDCGLVTGIAVDLERKIVHSGFTRSADGKHSDNFADLMFSDFIRMAESDDVRCVEIISDHFFALRREHLEAVGGLSVISSPRMPQLVKRLTLNARRRDLRVLVTPFAVATVEVAQKVSQQYLHSFLPPQSPTILPASTAVHGAPPLQLDSSSGPPIPESAQTNPRYAPWKYVIPLPPERMMGNIGAPSIENFLVVADAWGQVVNRHVPDGATVDGATVMDIGCGCGRVARVLVNNPHIRKYIGFDVMPDQVQWCRNFVEPAWRGVAEFHWFDLHSGKYNPNGALRAGNLTFPAKDKTVDVIFAASVFTHLFEADALHYLREIRRVLTCRGVALLSIHENVSSGERFSGTEARIDIDPDYFLELARVARLGERESSTDFCGQRLFTLERLK